MKNKLRGNDIYLICKNELEYIFLASLISSDNILTIEDAEKSLKFLDEVEEAVKDAPIADKKKTEFNEYISKGRDILNGDIEFFKAHKNK